MLVLKCYNEWTRANYFRTKLKGNVRGKNKLEKVLLS